MRLFTGIPIPHDIASKIVAFSRKQKIEGMKWVSFENLHVTLVFIGEVPHSRLSSIEKTIEGYARKARHFKLKFAGYEWAPPRRPYMIWATFARSQEYIRASIYLHRELGVPLEYEEPVPHITVGRLKHGFKPRDINDDGSLKGVILKVKSIALWESILKPEGPQYIKICEYELGGWKDS